MEITFFQGLWFLLIFVLIAGYFVLDGFDLGAGVLYPFVAKGDEEKAVVRTSIGPVWDGNEVWLLTAGGALFAAFPAAYATTFSGFYLAVMLVLFGLIVRAVSLEYRGIDHKWAKVWDGCKEARATRDGERGDDLLVLLVNPPERVQRRHLGVVHALHHGKLRGLLLGDGDGGGMSRDQHDAADHDAHHGAQLHRQ